MDKIQNILPQLKLSEKQWEILGRLIQAVGAAASDGKFSAGELFGIMVIAAELFGAK